MWEINGIKVCEHTMQKCKEFKVPLSGKRDKSRTISLPSVSPCEGRAGALPESMETEEAIPQVLLMGTKSDLTSLPAPPYKGFRSRISTLLSPAVPLSSHSLTVREPCGMKLHKSQFVQPPVFSYPILSAAITSPLEKSRSFPAQRVENHGFQISLAICPYGSASIYR